MKHLFAALVTAATLSLASHQVAFASEADAPINLNTATAEQLVTLNGIGDKKAAAIVAYRKEHGPFQSLDSLSEVKGIGETLIEKNRTRMTLDE